jgi:hypothetical protein
MYEKTKILALFIVQELATKKMTYDEKEVEDRDEGKEGEDKDEGKEGEFDSDKGYWRY